MLQFRSHPLGGKDGSSRPENNGGHGIPVAIIASRHMVGRNNLELARHNRLWTIVPGGYRCRSGNGINHNNHPPEDRGMVYME